MAPSKDRAGRGNRSAPPAWLPSCPCSKSAGSSCSNTERAISSCPPSRGLSSKTATGAGPNATGPATPSTSLFRSWASPFIRPCARSPARLSSRESTPRFSAGVLGRPYDATLAKTGGKPTKRALTTRARHAVLQPPLTMRTWQAAPRLPSYDDSAATLLSRLFKTLLTTRAQQFGRQLRRRCGNPAKNLTPPIWHKVRRQKKPQHLKSGEDNVLTRTRCPALIAR